MLQINKNSFKGKQDKSRLDYNTASLKVGFGKYNSRILTSKSTLFPTRNISGVVLLVFSSASSNQLLSKTNKTLL